MKFIDLSALIEPSPEGVPEFLRTDIEYQSHAQGAAGIQGMFNVPPDLLFQGEGWAVERITNLGTHSTTHIDAPWHYNSRIQGKRSETIDELPLEWFFSDGVILDMTHKADAEGMTAEEAQNELKRIRYTLKPLDIVMVRSGRDAFYGQPDYMFRGCGVTAEATHWLFDQGIRVMGIDAWGWDTPLDRQAREALSSGKPRVFWAAHQADLPYAQIERLMNLGGLPPYGFKVSCFPLKIKGGSAAPARIVAMVP